MAYSKGLGERPGMIATLPHASREGSSRRKNNCRSVIYLFVLADRLVMADHFLHDEVEELLRKIRVEFGIVGQDPKPRDLLSLAPRIGRRQAMRRLELAHRLRAFEPLRQQMDERGIDVVDAAAQ